ncbi:MAG: N-acetyl-gamma-glutamyl-phosphate reductase [Clostridia bacterium]|nr:N-acetyl-gamma-glutamyl-phosphate reductase [Clostridia bacterium]
MTKEKIKCGIIGATGYAGVELVRILSTHPQAEIVAVSSVSFEGQQLSDIYPNLRGICDMTLEGADEIIPRCDVIFGSLPHGLSEPFAEKCLSHCAVFIDLGADFRLHDEEDYSEWYGKHYEQPELHNEAVYAIPELYRDEIKGAEIIANPGCYPTSVALGLAPAIRGGYLEKGTVIVDSKSGVTGAGRSLTQGTHYPDTNEAFAAYKAGVHRHTPEIEQTLSEIAGEEMKVTFVPHLLPINRGIESSIYVKLRDGVSFDEVYAAYAAAYENELFVRVQPKGSYANLKNVRMSNYCDISLHFDKRTNMLIVSSCIDNMVKGAAGQAIQNMNLRFGLEESCGLDFVPPAF